MVVDSLGSQSMYPVILLLDFVLRHGSSLLYR